MALFERPHPEMGTEGDVVWRRAFAVIIDSIAIALVTSVFGVALARARLALLGSLVALLIGFGYFIYFEGTYGQTIGKMALNIAVVTEEGDHIGYRAATIRTLLRVLDALPVFYLVGLLVVFITEREQRLGDLAADTVVVRAR